VRTAGMTPQTLSGLGRWGKDIREDGRQVSFTISDEDALPAINRYLVGQNVQVYALTPQHVSLEDLFIQIVGTDGGL
jgi:ABC-2 type transport system ATP-binding protein